MLPGFNAYSQPERIGNQADCHMMVGTYTWEFEDGRWWHAMDESDCLEMLFNNKIFYAADMVSTCERRRWDLCLNKQFREWHDGSTWLITRERKIRRVCVT